MSDEVAQRVCGVLDVNSFELRAPASHERLRGVYLQAALMAHDCVANTHLAVDDSFLMTIHAAVDITRGAAITFNYTNALQVSEMLRVLPRKFSKYYSVFLFVLLNFQSIVGWVFHCLRGRKNPFLTVKKLCSLQQKYIGKPDKQLS